jgi:hypothetical protein
MARTRPSVQKRNKEAKVHEKKLAKAARKAARDAERQNRGDLPEGVDPDLVGLRVGPPEDHPDDEDDDEGDDGDQGEADDQAAPAPQR